MTEITGKIIGWRAWRVDAEGGLLPATMSGEPWQRGVNTAECRTQPGGHTAPGDDCECGLYAYYDGSYIPSYYSSLGSTTGVIVAWGNVELHADGFRAEHAEILSLICGDDASELKRLVTALVAERYGVRVLTRGDAAAYAREFGRRVPQSLIPEPDYASAYGSGNFSVGRPVDQGSLKGLARALAPRPVMIDGAVVKSATISGCYIHGAPLHLGRVARGLVAIGAVAGSVAGLVVGGLLF